MTALPGVASGRLPAHALAVAGARRARTSSLLARAIDCADPGTQHGARWAPALPVPAGARPAWVSEAHARPVRRQASASTLRLPLGGACTPFFVAGVWRDYAQPDRLHPDAAGRLPRPDRRQRASAMRRCGRATASTRRHAGSALARAAVRRRAGRHANPGDIRALSLKIFDRSFAVTYLLEAIAIVIGLFGVAATLFGPDPGARARIRHAAPRRRHARPGLAHPGASKAAR